MALPPIGSTCAEPPPEIMPTSECEPITAMVCSLRGVQRQDGLLILEQNDAALFDLARGFKSGKRIDDAALAWMIDHAGRKHGAQNAMHMLVEFGCGILPASTASLNLSLEQEPARLLVIESGGGGLFSRCACRPSRRERTRGTSSPSSAHRSAATCFRRRSRR